MPDFSRDTYWRDLPNGIIEQDQRQTAAQEWGTQARTQLASQWADSARSEIAQQFPDLAADMPAPQTDAPQSSAAPAAGVPPPVAASEPSASPASAPTTAPQSFGSVTPTTVDIGLGSRPADQSTDRNQLIAAIGDIARKAGLGDEGAKVAQAIVVTEGGLAGAVGDVKGGGSYGPFQFYWQGQLKSYARDNGMSLDKAAEYARTHPLEAADWALNNYLGHAIQAGMAQGLTGAALATYAQRHGQVSESPERAGQNYAALFGGNADPFAGAAPMSMAEKPPPGLPGDTPAPRPTLDFGSIVQQAQQAVNGAGEAVGGAVAAVGNAVGPKFEDVVNSARQAVGYVGDQVSQGASTLASGQESVGRGSTQAADIATQAASQGLGEFATGSSPVSPSSVMSGAEQAAGNAVRPALDALANSGANQLRHEYFPNLTEPGHPLNPETPLDTPGAAFAFGGMTGPVNAGQGGLKAAQAAVDALRQRFPQMSEGSIAASGAGRDLARLQAEAGTAVRRPAPDVWNRPIASEPLPARSAPQPVDTQPGGLMRTLGQIDESSGPAGPTKGQLGMFGDQSLPYGGPKPSADELLGPPGPQRGQFQMGSDLPYGGPRPTGNESLGPSGPQRGQLQIGSELPYGGPRPTGEELLGPSGPQRGQLQIGSELPYGGPKPSGNEMLGPSGPQRGQLQMGSELPYGGPRPTGNERMGPIGELPGQKPLPGTPSPPSTFGDKAIALRYGSMLSSWYTHVQNATSNTGQMLVRPIRLTAAGYPGEAGAAVRGYMQGIPDGVAAFWDVMKNGASAAGKVEQNNPHPFGTGVFGRTLDMPTTLLHAADDFFKSVVYSGAIRSEATRLAKGDQATFEELLKSPTANMVREATQQAKISTYQEDPGRIVNKLLGFQQGLNANERLAVNFVMPFIRTPSNILRRGIQFSAQPLTGPVKVGMALARGDMRAARLEAADTALAGIVALGFASKAAAGELSGDGPKNAAERQQLLDQGWQPHSIRVGDRWVDYSWAGPLAIQMALIANMNEAAHDGRQGAPTDEQALNVVNRMKNTLLQQSFLRGIGDLFKNSQSGDAAAVASYLGSNVPMGGFIKDIAEATDPLKRQADPGIMGVPSRLAERIPVAREMVRPDQTSLGEPAANPRSGFGVLRGSTATTDPTLSKLEQHGVTIPAAPKTITRGAGPIQLTPDEQDAFNTTRGQLIRRYVDRVVAQPSFQRLNPAAQTAELKSVISTQTEAAKDWTLKRLGNTEITRREKALATTR